MKPNYPNRVHLAHLPTPLERLDRLSHHLNGPEILIKRDDLTGLATGGNKTRKLEFLVAEAEKQGSDHLVTNGSAQSNHCRQTAAAAARRGLGCSLVLNGHDPGRYTGNLLLDRLLGAHLFWAEDRPVADTVAEVVAELEAMGRTPYTIPLGGSNVVGVTGYVLAMQELKEQLQEQRQNIDFIVFATASGGTQAGIVLGAHVYDLHARVLGISVQNPAAMQAVNVSALATATATHLGLGTISVSDRVEVNEDYVGEGYAIVSDAEREAIRMVAGLEGIVLDPVYTGRAMAGLIDLIRWGAFTRGQTVLFWHTGGTAALPAFADKLL